MRYLKYQIIIPALWISIAYAQQDPNDPGLQDSIIIEGMAVDSGAGAVVARMWMVIDDSIMYYNIPLTWNAPQGGVNPINQTIIFPGWPPYEWEIYDTVVTSPPIIWYYGYCLDTICPPLITNGERVNIFNIRFHINPGTPGQTISVGLSDDTLLTYPLQFGIIDGLTSFRPAFQGGYMTIRSLGVADDPAIPGIFELKQNYPNPFNPSTIIEFSLAKGEDVTLALYDLLGRQIRILQDGRLDEGAYSVIWDGRDDTGRDVPSGTYFYRLMADDNTQVKRMTLVR